jgi:hypothetical protein
MTVRFLLTSPLLVGLLLAGCIVPPPPEEEPTDPGGPVPGPSEPAPGPAEPAPLPEGAPLVVALPPALWKSGGYVSVARMREGQPAQESVTQVPGGTREFVVDVEEGEVVGVSLLDGAGQWVSSTTLRARPLGARPAVEPRVLRVPQEYPTLQAAVDMAWYGDTVRVAPGTYKETVKLKSGIRLLGSGAASTILDGGGLPVKLVDFSQAQDVVVAGFTFQNVARSESGCSQPEDVMLCSGNWYAAAVYGASDSSAPGVVPASALVTHNVFRRNHIGMLLYYRAPAVVRNNVFLENTHGLVANHYGSEVALVANNVFWMHTEHAIVSQAAYLHLWNNVIAHSSVGVLHRHVQTGDIRCNVFFLNFRNGWDEYGPSRVHIGVDGNVEVDPRFEHPEGGDFRLRFDVSPVIDAGCFEEGGFDLGSSRQDIGAYGGVLGRW